MGQAEEFRTLIFAINRIETVRAIFRLLEERHASGSQPKPEGWLLPSSGGFPVKKN